MMLHEGMKLHPWLVSGTFVIFAILCAMTMFKMIKQRRMGLAGLMFVSTVAMAVSAFVSSTVSAG
jgi:hypothetical protein